MANASQIVKTKRTTSPSEILSEPTASSAGKNVSEILKKPFRAPTADSRVKTNHAITASHFKTAKIFVRRSWRCSLTICRETSGRRTKGKEQKTFDDLHGGI